MTGVTLRKFLEIVGECLVMPYLCEVWIETNDESNEFSNIERIPFGDFYFITNRDDLLPYMDFEVVNYNQRRDCSNVDGEFIVLRNIL